MSKFYKLILLVLLITISENLLAQKTLRLRVTQVTNNPGTECDGFISGDSDWQWTWDIPSGNQVGCEYLTNNNPNTFNIDNTIWGTNTYYSRNCWPTGNLGVVFRYGENDNAGDCNSSGTCSRTDNWTYPVYNAANNDYQQNGTSLGTTTYSGTCTNDCPTAITYGMTGRWTVGGSNFNATNLDGNGYVNNTSCATAVNLGSGTGFGASGNYATQCNNTWFFYDLTVNSNTLTINPSQGSSSVTVYYSATNSCSDLCQRASGTGSATVHGAPAGRYYFQLGSSGGANTNIAISRTATSHDQIRYATNVALNYSASVNNSSFTESPGEPNPAGDIYNTWWYTFTTPAGGYPYVEASISEGTGNNSAVAIYQSNGTNCTPFGYSLTTLASDRWCASSGGSVGINCLPGNTTYFVQYGTASNFALCIGGENTGSYNVSINSGAPSGQDNLCSPHDFGVLNAGANTGNVFYNNSCLTTQAGEPRLGDMSHTMWYKFTTPATGLRSATIEVEEAGEGANLTAVAIYRRSGSCAFGSLTEVGFDRWCASDGGSVTIDCLEPNTEYYIQLGTGYHFALCTNILNGSRSTGRYRLRVTTSSVLPGPNDVCSAVNLGTSTLNSTLSSGTGTGNNNFCANATGEAAWVPSFGKDQTVWYSFSTGATVGSNISVQVRNDPASHGDQIASELAVFKRTTCNSGTVSLVAEDNPVPFFGNGTEVNFCPEPNTNYWIMVDHDPFFTGAGEGYFDVRVFHNNATQGPDNVCSAQSMGTFANYTSGTISLPTISNHSNECATTQANEPSGGQKTTWYTFTTGNTVGKDINITVDAISGGLDAEVYIYRACNTVCTGSNLNTGVFTELANYWDALLIPALGIGEWDASGTLSNVIRPNTTYYIRVDGVNLYPNGLEGIYNLSLSMSGGTYIANDNYCGAHELSSTFNFNTSNISHTVNTDNASSEDICTTDEPNVSNEQTAWWKFTTGANPPAVITVNPDATGICTGQAWVYSGAASGACTGNSFTNYLGSNNFSGLTLVGSTALGGDINIDCPSPNTAYYIMGKVGGLCSSGSLTINLSSNQAPRLGNDQCAGAINLGTFTTGGQTLGDATGANRWNNFCMTNTGDPNPGWLLDPNARKLVWFKFNTGELGRVVDIAAITDPGNYGDNIDLKVALYTGTCGSLVYIDRDYILTYH